MIPPPPHQLPPTKGKTIHEKIKKNAITRPENRHTPTPPSEKQYLTPLQEKINLFPNVIHPPGTAPFLGVKQKGPSPDGPSPLFYV